MKTTHILSAALLAALSLTSCGSDDTAVDQSLGSLRFNIGVADTRASHVDASTINSIYVNCLYDGTQIMPGGFAMLPVSGGVASACPEDMEWLGHNGIMEIEALAFNDGGLTVSPDGRAEFAIETTQTASSYKSDLLCCTRRGTYSEISDGGAVDLNFRHALSELTVNVHMPSDDIAGVSEMTIGGTAGRAVCHYENGKLSIDAGIPGGASPSDYFADIIPYEVSSGSPSVVSYRCILIPQVVNGLTFFFRHDGIPYRYVKNNVSLAPDTRYTVDFYAGAAPSATSAGTSCPVITSSSWTCR